MSKYDLLSQDELEERFLPPHPDTSPSLDRRKSQISRISPLLCLITSTILFLSSLALFIYSYRTLTNADSQCYSKWNTPSPLQEAINPPITTRVDGRFWKEDSYKGPPSPERDTAWEELTDGPDGGVTTISREQLVAMNASEHSIELPNGRYPASFEVVHLMHCLNFLRQATYEEYYKDKALPWHDSLGTVRVHMDHCIDILRQKLMCDADTGLITYVWVKGRKNPYPDFSVQKKCRNFDNVKQWVRGHYVDIHNLTRLPGAYEFEDDI